MRLPISRILAAFVIVLAIAGLDTNVDTGDTLVKAERLLRRNDRAQARAVVSAIIDGDMQKYCSVAQGFYADARETSEPQILQVLIDQAQHVMASKRLCKEERALYHSGNAMLYEEMGQLYEAETEYRKALALETESPQLLNMLGWFYAQNGIRLEQALKLTKKAARLAPENAAIVDSLGWAYYKLGKYDKAIATLRRAVELDPESADLRYHLGAAYMRKGSSLQARIELNKALLLNPAYPEPRNLLRKLS